MTSASRRGDGRLKIVVHGYVVRCPIGGMTWHYLQYAMGLARMGHDVYFIEVSDDFEQCCYDPVNHLVSSDPTVGIRYTAEVFERAGLGDRWAYHDRWGQGWLGPLGDDAAKHCREADVFVNPSGTCTVGPWFEDIPVRVMIDTDPGFEQVRQITVPARRQLVTEHTHFFTFGENIPAGTSLLPDDGIPWKATRQPIVLDAWPVAPDPGNAPFTTVLQWDSYKTRTLGDLHLGMKSQSFQPYVARPSSTEERLQLALGGETAPREDLERAGWEIVDPLAVTRDPWTYGDYIRRSKGELTVAKHGYVVAKTGWFSERSAAYLASGRPVVTEDTGSPVPSGAGLFTFDSPSGAAAALESVASDYGRHSRSARELAETWFGSGEILRDLLDSCFEEPAPAVAELG